VESALLLASCVTSGRYLNLSKPESPTYVNGDAEHLRANQHPAGGSPD
jgi:hypothetical protein